MAHVIRVTRKDLRPPDNHSLLRWFDRLRWKFGEEEWFAEAEQAIEVGDVPEAYRLATAGVQSSFRRAPAPVTVPASSLAMGLEARLRMADEEAEMKERAAATPPSRPLPRVPHTVRKMDIPPRPEPPTSKGGFWPLLFVIVMVIPLIPILLQRGLPGLIGIVGLAIVAAKVIENSRAEAEARRTASWNEYSVRLRAWEKEKEYIEGAQERAIDAARERTERELMEWKKEVEAFNAALEERMRVRRRPKDPK
jgi:hypothetical protein